MNETFTATTAAKIHCLRYQRASKLVTFTSFFVTLLRFQRGKRAERGVEFSRERKSGCAEAEKINLWTEREESNNLILPCGVPIYSGECRLALGSVTAICCTLLETLRQSFSAPSVDAWAFFRGKYADGLSDAGFTLTVLMVNPRVCCTEESDNNWTMS